MIWQQSRNMLIRGNLYHKIYFIWSCCFVAYERIQKDVDDWIPETAPKNKMKIVLPWNKLLLSILFHNVYGLLVIRLWLTFYIAMRQVLSTQLARNPTAISLIQQQTHTGSTPNWMLRSWWSPYQSTSSVFLPPFLQSFQ